MDNKQPIKFFLALFILIRTSCCVVQINKRNGGTLENALQTIEKYSQIITLQHFKDNNEIKICI